MREEYQRELQLLAIGLIRRGIQFEFRDCFEGGQILVYEPTGCPYDISGELIRKWDAVCHDGSYGHEVGKLEIMGDLVDKTKTDDDVEGLLTAEEILERLDKEVKE
jgi:hypothetical protein